MVIVGIKNHSTVESTIVGWAAPIQKRDRALVRVYVGGGPNVSTGQTSGTAIGWLTFSRMVSKGRPLKRKISEDHGQAGGRAWRECQTSWEMLKVERKMKTRSEEMHSRRADSRDSHELRLCWAHRTRICNYPPPPPLINNPHTPSSWACVNPAVRLVKCRSQRGDVTRLCWFNFVRCTGELGECKSLSRS